ncbi:MAG TPA: PEGA domain-containing protein, partial [Candidatus Cybelea sp.]|nr:PEGA domain-containing protein [Candidatus Cybelea sp.]
MPILRRVTDDGANTPFEPAIVDPSISRLLSQTTKPRLCALVLLAATAACAPVRPIESLLAGTQQNVTFESEPAGAMVTVDGVALGETPLTVPLERVRDHYIELRKKRYQTEAVQLVSRADASKGIVELTPASVTVALRPAVPTATDERVAEFQSKLNALNAMQSQGLISNDEYG